jgi:hypothetical protein
MKTELVQSLAKNFEASGSAVPYHFADVGKTITLQSWHAPGYWGQSPKEPVLWPSLRVLRSSIGIRPQKPCTLRCGNIDQIHA